MDREKPTAETTTSRVVSQDVLDVLSKLDDDEWLQLILRGGEAAGPFRIPSIAPEAIQRRFNVLAGEENLRFGFRIYRALKGCVEGAGCSLHGKTRVLDFGCGWGRVIRFFLKDVLSTNLYGIDIDAPAVSSCKESMPDVSFDLIHACPPTPFRSGMFDLIYAHSVFSHLPEALHLDWLAEFSRILKPGGLLIVSTHGPAYIEKCRSLRGSWTCEHPWQREAAQAFVDTDSALGTFQNGQFLFSPLPSPTYGNALIPRAYVERVWSKFLNVRRFIDENVLLPQALIVAQKPS